MKKYTWVFLILLTFAVILVINKNKPSDPELPPTEVVKNEQIEEIVEEPQTSLSNPASDFCIKNGGELKIITESNGGQFGLCKLSGHSCEEWTYFRGECDVQGDGDIIRQELINKGLNLTQTKVVINNHLGKYIGASVVPVSGDAGGGYVFAVKNDGVVKVLADGNGTISCDAFKEFPDFSSYLVPECVDTITNSIVVR